METVIPSAADFLPTDDLPGIPQKTAAPYLAAVMEMLDFIREHRAHLNSFNLLVDEAIAKPDWLAALLHPGVTLLLKAYCHD